MKKLTTIIGITLLSAVLALPVLGWAHGWGGGNGGHMMGHWGAGPGYYDRYDGSYGRGTADRRNWIDEEADNDETETRDIVPDNRFRGGYGRHRGGYGMGFGSGRHMGGWGMGYGPGSCRN
jgi:hypothetical protein